MAGSEVVNTSIAEFNMSSFCTRDDQETSRVCLTQEDAPSCCFPEFPHYFNIIAATYCFLLTVVGGFGNLMALVAIPYGRLKTTDPRSPLKSPTTVLLISVSLADCLFCFINMSGLGVTYLLQKWVFGTIYCHVTGYFFLHLYLASSNSLAAATMSRALQLWWPACNDVLFKSYSGVPAAVFAWMLAAVVPTFGEIRYGSGYSRRKGTCTLTIEGEQRVMYFLFGIATSLPWVIVLFCLLLIWIKLRQNWSQLKEFKYIAKGTLQDLKERERKMTILLTLLALAYSSTAAPVVIIYLAFKGSVLTKPYVYYTLFLHYHFLINVFLYVYRIPSYRDAFILFYRDTRDLIHGRLSKFQSTFRLSNKIQPRSSSN